MHRINLAQCACQNEAQTPGHAIFSPVHHTYIKQNKASRMKFTGQVKMNP
uniref:Uncharacterized protein n=1 Tax=Arion vulgaris TaxID=1028688 RepID=A0A0B6Y8Z6_9EUPU